MTNREFVENIRGITPEALQDAIGDYIAEHPIPDAAYVNKLVNDHIEDTTPHPVYDNLAEGHFTTFFRNGLS